MPVTYLYTENTISEWRTYFNILGANVGDLDRLDLGYYPDLVSAINAVGTVLVTGSFANLEAQVIANLANVEANIISNLLSLQGNAVSNITANVANLTPNLVATVLANITANVANLESNLTAQVSANITAIIANAQANVATISANVANLQANVANVSAAVANAQANVGNLNANISNISANVAVLTANVANVAANVAVLTSNLANISANVGNLQANVANVIASITANVLANVSNATANVSADLANLTTDNVAEGSVNLYFTNARSRHSISVLGNSLVYNTAAGILEANLTTLASTDYLPEGNANLYFTNARAQAVIGAYLDFQSPLSFDEPNGTVSLDLLTTDNVNEGSVNLYFSNTRARAAISTIGNALIYDANTGVLSANFSSNIGVVFFNGQTGDVSVDSDDIPEGVVNLYFTTANWNARLSSVYTSNIAENPDANLANTTIGNVYFTNARARSALSNADATIVYDQANGTLRVNTDALIAGVSNVNGANSSVILFTSNIAENPDANLANTDIGNVYFTNTRARQSISVSGAASYDTANGVISVPGPYGFAYRRYVYTLGSATNTIQGADNNGHSLIIDQAAATDIFVNGVKTTPGTDYVINNNFSSSNVVFSLTLPVGTEVQTQELTGNAAVMQGYITETRTDFVEPLYSFASAANVDINLGNGSNTAFRVNVEQSTTFTFSNPPLAANKAFYFSIFLNFGPANSGNYVLGFPANVRWDDNSPPSFTASPSTLEVVTFFTLDAGTLYYGFKNLSNAPLV